jgi:hypothetical protein
LSSALTAGANAANVDGILDLVQFVGVTVTDLTGDNFAFV